MKANLLPGLLQAEGKVSSTRFTMMAGFVLFAAAIFLDGFTGFTIPEAAYGLLLPLLPKTAQPFAEALLARRKEATKETESQRA